MLKNTELKTFFCVIRYKFVRVTGYIIVFVIFSSFTRVETNMTITIKGITELKGNLMLAIFDKSQGFGADEYACDKKVIKVLQSNQEIKLSNLIEGKKYAIALYHDVNCNEFLDKNILGMPLEKYGFSNDARGTFGPPSFETAAFFYNKGKRITITIK